MTNVPFVGIPAFPRQVWYSEGLPGSKSVAVEEVEMVQIRTFKDTASK